MAEPIPCPCTVDVTPWVIAAPGGVNNTSTACVINAHVNHSVVRAAASYFSAVTGQSARPMSDDGDQREPLAALDRGVSRGRAARRRVYVSRAYCGLDVLLGWALSGETLTLLPALVTPLSPLSFTSPSRLSNFFFRYTFPPIPNVFRHRFFY